MAEQAKVIGCHTVQQWTHSLDIAKQSHKLVVVDFTASWCGPCRTIAPFVDECAKEYPNVLFLKVDVDEREEIAEQWGIQAMPSFIFLIDGQEVQRIIGPDKTAITAAILKHSTTTTAAAAAAPEVGTDSATTTSAVPEGTDSA